MSGTPSLLDCETVMDPGSDSALSDAELDQDHDHGEQGQPVQDQSLRDAPAKNQNEPVSTNTPLQKLACDHCRHRKARCDRQNPCSRCVRMHIRCNYTAQPRPRPKRPHTNPYITKMDELSRKIDTMCRLLEDDTHRASPTSHVSDLNHTSSPLSTSLNSTRESDTGKIEPSEAEYEGDSALSAHTTYATRFLEAIVGQEISPKQSTSSSESRHNQVPGLSSLSLPPASMVFTCLRILQENPQAGVLWTFELESTDHFQEYFLRAYSSSQPTTAEQIIILHSLASLFYQCAWFTTDQAQKQEFETHGAACHKDIEAVIFKLPFHLPTNFDYVLALGMAVEYCVETCQLMLAWDLNCVAVRMALSLGFHKAYMQDPEQSIPTRRRARLFVALYMSDKMLSLRLGRGSMIRDVEIPTDYRTMLRGVNSAPSPVAPFWVGFARIQGLVYDQLYSPRALQQPQEVRYSDAKGLAEELDTLCNTKDDIKDQFNHSLKSAVGEELADLLQRSDRISQLALKCLIYRSVQPFATGLPFYEDCIHHAREALKEHRECIILFAKYEATFLEIYFHWALLSSPFVPFITILCNVVETRNHDDLELLRMMIVSIESISETMPVISRQLQVFQPLYNALSKFIQAHTALHPPIGDFGAFFEESNAGISLAPALLSTFAQSEQPDGTRGGQGYADTSFMDVWMQLDSTQADPTIFQG